MQIPFLFVSFLTFWKKSETLIRANKAKLTFLGEDDCSWSENPILSQRLFLKMGKNPHHSLHQRTHHHAPQKLVFFAGYNSYLSQDTKLPTYTYQAHTKVVSRQTGPS
jgi:hypothetical protein